MISYNRKSTRSTPPITRLRIRLARLNGDSIATMSREHDVTTRTVMNLTSSVPKAPDDRDAALNDLKLLTLRELGASLDDVGLWRAMQAAAGAPEQPFIVPYFDLPPRSRQVRQRAPAPVAASAQEAAP